MGTVVVVGRQINMTRPSASREDGDEEVHITQWNNTTEIFTINIFWTTNTHHGSEEDERRKRKDVDG